MMDSKQSKKTVAPSQVRELKPIDYQEEIIIRASHLHRCVN